MATTTNYAWETPDDTDLVKDGAAAIRTLGSSIDTTTKALNPSTTLGDIEYRSSTADTNTRLGIGTTGQVLTVSGGVPSWATPAGSAVKACALYKSANQSISNNTLTAVTFNSEFFDTNSFHSTVTNTSRITVPTTGYYQVNGILTWRANTNAGDLYSYLKVNGTTNLATPWIESGAANDGVTISISTIANLTANDYLELYVLQLTGISKDLWANTAQDCTFSVSYLGA